jgi:hypothetical protein
VLSVCDTVTTRCAHYKVCKVREEWHEARFHPSFSPCLALCHSDDPEFPALLVPSKHDYKPL